MGDRLFCTPELRGLQRIANDLGIDVQYHESDSKVVIGFAVFVDVVWLLERERVFKSYVVEVPGDSSTCSLFSLPLSQSSTANNLLRKVFAFFEADNLNPVETGHGLVFAMDPGTHLGNNNSIRINSTSSFDAQLDALILNVNLHRLGGCIPDRRTAWSNAPVSQSVRDRFFATMAIKQPQEMNDAVFLETVLSLGKLIQRNLYLLGLYPSVDQGTSPLRNGVFDESVWIDGLICNTTILGMTDFVSEFGPFDATSLHTLSEYSILQPTLISTLFRTTLSLRNTLTSLGFPPHKPFSEKQSTPSRPNSIIDSQSGYQSTQIGDWKDFQVCVGEFQKAYGLKVTGIMGEATRKKMQSLVKDFTLGDLGVVGIVSVGSTDGDFSRNEKGSLLIKGQQGFSRGIDRFRGGGVIGGPSASSSSSSKAGGAERVGDGDDLGIDLFLSVAKAVEESHRASAAAMAAMQEKRARKQELKEAKKKSKSKSISPARLATVGRESLGIRPRPQLSVDPENRTPLPPEKPALLSTTAITTGPIKKTSFTESPLITKSSFNSMGSTTSKQPSASTTHPPPASPNSQPSQLLLAPSTSYRSLTPRMSPIPSSDSDNDFDSDDATSPTKAPGKLLQGIKNIGRNVKMFAQLAGKPSKETHAGYLRGGVSHEGMAVSGPLLAGDGVGRVYRASTTTSPVIVGKASGGGGGGVGVENRESMMRMTRSLSVGDIGVKTSVVEMPDISVATEDEASTSPVTPITDAGPAFLKRSMSETRLSGLRLEVPDASSVSLSLSRKSVGGQSRGSLFLEDAGRLSPALSKKSRTSKSIKKRRSKRERVISIALVGDSETESKKILSDGYTDVSDMDTPTIATRDETDKILETSTDIPTLTKAIAERLAALRDHPQISSEIKNNPDNPSPLVALLQSIDSASTQISAVTKQIRKSSNDTEPPLENQSIAQLLETQASLSSRIQTAISTRSQQKQQLIQDLKSLVAAQGQAVALIDALQIQTQKVKYAVALLEARVSETEEAGRVFVQRIHGVEARLKEGSKGIGLWEWVMSVLGRTTESK